MCESIVGSHPKLDFANLAVLIGKVGLDFASEILSDR